MSRPTCDRSPNMNYLTAHLVGTQALLSTRKPNSLLSTSLFARRAAKPTLTGLNCWNLRICPGGGELRKRAVHHPNGPVLIAVQKLPSAAVMSLLRNLLLKVISWNLQELGDTCGGIVKKKSSHLSPYECVCSIP